MCGAGAQAEGEDEIISFPRLSNKRPYLVLVPGQRSKERDESDAVVLLVIDTEQRTKVSGETLVRLYNLTPAETRVALMLIDGKRLDQIAGELEVAQTTIVFHLKNLFRKTGDAPAGGPRPGPALGSAADEFPLKRFQVKCLGSGADDAVSDSRNRRNDRLCGELFSLRFRPAEAAEECDP